MANVWWVGGATAVAQIAQGSIDTVDGTPADNTFTVTIGGIAVSVAGDTDVATTAGALLTALQASTHPYFTAVTWTNPSAGNITGVASVAGVPFVATLTETGSGTGTVTDFSTTTASAGPSDWSTAANWSGGAVPVSSDTVTIGNASANLVFGLDQNAVALTQLIVLRDFTGKIGAPANQFVTSADGATTSSAVNEYREHYLKISATDVDIGLDQGGQGSSTASSRVKINNTKASGASQTVVHKTGSSSADSPLPAVRLLFANSSADLCIQDASAGVGVASEAGETSTLGDIWHMPQSSSDRLVIGWGVTWTNTWQTNGVSSVQAANTPTRLEVLGGTCTPTGQWQLTTLCVRGGTCHYDAWHSSTPITTIDMKGGTLDLMDLGIARKPIAATLNLDGGVVHMSDDLHSFTAINEPTGGPKSITVADL